MRWIHLVTVGVCAVLAAAACGDSEGSSGTGTGTGTSSGSSTGSATGSSGSCGDGVLDTGAGEACDDGNTANGDGCSSTCTVEGGNCGGQGSECIGDTDCGATETCSCGVCVAA